MRLGEGEHTHKNITETLNFWPGSCWDATTTHSQGPGEGKAYKKPKETHSFRPGSCWGSCLVLKRKNVFLFKNQQLPQQLPSAQI